MPAVNSITSTTTTTTLIIVVVAAYLVSLCKRKCSGLVAYRLVGCRTVWKPKTADWKITRGPITNMHVETNERRLLFTSEPCAVETTHLRAACYLSELPLRGERDRVTAENEIRYMYGCES